MRSTVKMKHMTPSPTLVWTSYRDIVEHTAGMCCPNIFGVRIANNGAILTAAIGHQVFHVALPRHIQEIDAIYIKIPKASEVWLPNRTQLNRKKTGSRI